MASAPVFNAARRVRAMVIESSTSRPCAMYRALSAHCQRPRRKRGAGRTGGLAKRIKVRSSANGRAVPALAAAPRSTGDAALAFHPSDRLTSGYGDSTTPDPNSPSTALRGASRSTLARSPTIGAHLRPAPRRDGARLSSRPTPTGSASPKLRRRCGRLARAFSSSPIGARGSRRAWSCQRPRSTCSTASKPLQTRRITRAIGSRRSSATKRSFGAGRRSLRGAAGPRPALCISTPA